MPDLIMLTIDPNVNSTGVALWIGKRLHAADRIKNIYRAAKGHTWVDRALTMSAQVSEWVYAWGLELGGARFDVVAIEWPSMFESSAGKMAATRTGKTFKLAGLCGMILKGIEDAVGAEEYRIVDVNEWKGQLKKGMVIERLKPEFGERAKDEGWNHDVWEAVGIGKFLLGEF